MKAPQAPESSVLPGKQMPSGMGGQVLPWTTTAMPVTAWKSKSAARVIFISFAALGTGTSRGRDVIH